MKNKTTIVVLTTLLLTGLHAETVAAGNSDAVSPEQTSADHDFRDHGVAVPIASCRGVYVVETSEGKHLAVATSFDQSPRGWILLADIDTGVVEQIMCPDNVANSPPYGSVMGRNGKFYTSQGPVFLEFDPVTKEWTFQKRAKGARAILTMAESPDGKIWMGNVYQAGLHSFNPETRTFKDHGRMDNRETYLQSLGFDDEGWVYAGIGTARENLVAYNPKTGEQRQLADEEKRSTGSGRVWNDPETGKLYGRVHGEIFRLSGGRAEPVEKAPRAAAADGYGSQPQLPNGRNVSFDFAQRVITVKKPDETSRTITFDYKTAGSAIRPQAIAAGPDGKIYLNSGHPAYTAAYDPASDTLDYFPDPNAQQCLGVQGKYVFGGRYTGGKLKLFDTTRPWNKHPTDGSLPNPFRAIPSSRPDINRPIVAFAHPDGVRVIIAGMPGYGRTGGGLSIYNIETGEIQKYNHEQLIKHHSITALSALPDGRLAGSTTVSGTHGGHAIATAAKLFTLDQDAGKVTWKTTPLPLLRAIHLLKAGADGRLYCVGTGSVFFVFDLEKQEVVHKDSIAAKGGGGQILELPDGETVFITNNAFYEFDTDAYEMRKITDSPAPVGKAVYSDGRIYFSSGTRLWSLDASACMERE